MTTAQIQVVLDATQAAQTVGQLKQNMKDLTAALANTRIGTQQFRDLTAAMDDVRDKLKLIRREVGSSGLEKSLQGLVNTGQAMAAGFQVAQGALNLFGIESQEVQQAMMKLQAAMAISQGLNQLIQAFEAAKIASQGLNASLLANPYVLVAAAVTAAAVAIFYYVRANSEAVKAEKEAEKQRKRMKEISDSNIESMTQEIFQLEALTHSLKDSNLTAEQRKKVIDQLNAQYGTTLTNLSTEKEIIEQTDLAYKNLINSLAKKIIIQQTEDLTKPLIQKKAQLMIDRQQWQLNRDQAQSTVDNLKKSSQANTTYAGIIADNEKILKDANLQLSTYDELIRDVDESLNEIVGNSGLSFFETLTPAKNTDKKVKDALDKVKAIQDAFKAQLVEDDNAFILKRIEIEKQYLDGIITNEEDYNIQLKQLEGENLTDRLNTYTKFSEDIRNNTELTGEERISILNDVNSQIIKLTESNVLSQIELNKAMDAKIANEKKIAYEKLLNQINTDYYNKEIQLIQDRNNGIIQSDFDLNYKLAALDIDRQEATLSTLEKGSVEYLQKKAEIDLKKLQLEQKHNEDLVKASEETAKKQADTYMKTIGDIQKYATTIANAVTSIVTVIFDFMKQESDAALAELQANTEASLANAETLQKQGILSEKEYQQEVRNINMKARQEEKKLKKEAWEADKASKIIQAVIATALGVVSAFQGGPILGPIMAGVAAAVGAAQIALIASQPTPKFATGVLNLQGPGTGTSDSITAQLSKGESVITAENTKKYWPILQMIQPDSSGPKNNSNNAPLSGFNNTQNNEIVVKAIVDPYRTQEVLNRMNQLKEGRKLR